MMTPETMPISEQGDAALVARCLAGHRGAFEQIVTRYQSLICSLAYSATGSLSQSEDLAQETFVAAWKQLRDLREPEKLRAWLCGIARNLTHNALRQRGRESKHVVDGDDVDNSAAPEPSPTEQTISREEESILWQSLERVPETYREPLILFYRQHQSIERVAEALNITNETARQRLSRGRKLLREQVLAFIEGALERTNPGRAFTFGVLAALPVYATSAGAATVASAALKGSTTASSATWVSLVTSLLGPIIGVLGAWLGVRASLEATRTPRERKFVVRQTKIMIAVAAGFNVAVAGYVLVAVNSWSQHPILFAALGVAIPLGFAGFIVGMAFRYNRGFRRIRKEERQRDPEAYKGERSVLANEFREYRSRWKLLGLPLVHVRVGGRQGEITKPAIGWIALGDRAYGILFAAGGVAIGAISFGGVAAGVVAFGGACVGLLAIGGFALGGLALGGGAIGLVAAGGVATAWIGAEGGLAVAREFALGGQALARHANNAAAREFFAQFPWMDLTKAGIRNALVIICWLPMLLVIWQSLRTRKRHQSFKAAQEGEV